MREVWVHSHIAFFLVWFFLRIDSRSGSMVFLWSSDFHRWIIYDAAISHRWIFYDQRKSGNKPPINHGWNFYEISMIHRWDSLVKPQRAVSALWFLLAFWTNLLSDTGLCVLGCLWPDDLQYVPVALGQFIRHKCLKTSLQQSIHLLYIVHLEN